MEFGEIGDKEVEKRRAEYGALRDAEMDVFVRRFVTVVYDALFSSFDMLVMVGVGFVDCLFMVLDVYVRLVCMRTT